MVLKRDLLCVDPFDVHGDYRPVATQVDHIIPRSECQRLELTLSNLAGLCSSCHSRKTRKEMTR